VIAEGERTFLIGGAADFRSVLCRFPDRKEQRTMIEFFGMRAISTATVVTVGGLGAVVIQVPARAAGFSAGYTCTVPVLGARSVTMSGTLTAWPSRPAVNTRTRFRLHISSLSLRSPVAINSWSAAAEIDVSGAQSASFRLAGSGASLPAHQPVTGDLAGYWTPRVRGTHELRAGNVTLRANMPLLGDVTALCTPNAPRPVLATLTVAPSPRGFRDVTR
jgi:hypothetical protein